MTGEVASLAPRLLVLASLREAEDTKHHLTQK